MGTVCGDEIIEISFDQSQGNVDNLMLKCKNLMSYTVKMSDLFGTPKLLSKKQMPGGYAIPEGIFRIEATSSETFQSQHQHATQTSEAVNWPMIKLTLYPIVKEFIQRQESYGNIVKFSRYDPNYLYVHQVSPYKDKQAHIFVWSILSQKVVRRMLFISEAFSPNMIEPDYFQRIEYFAVSPRGTYMLGVVDGQQLCKKYLPVAELKQFKSLLAGCVLEDRSKKDLYSYVQVQREDQDLSEMTETSFKKRKSQAKKRMDTFLDVYQKFITF